MAKKATKTEEKKSKPEKPATTINQKTEKQKPGFFKVLISSLFIYAGIITFLILGFMINNFWLYKYTALDSQIRALTNFKFKFAIPAIKQVGLNATSFTVSVTNFPFFAVMVSFLLILYVIG